MNRRTDLESGIPVALERATMRARELDPLYRYLLSHGIAVAWLATRMSIHPRTIVSIFQGLVYAPPQFLERACAVLEIPVSRVRPRTVAPRRKAS